MQRYVMRSKPKGVACPVEGSWLRTIWSSPVQPWPSAQWLPLPRLKKHLHDQRHDIDDVKTEVLPAVVSISSGGFPRRWNTGAHVWYGENYLEKNNCLVFFEYQNGSNLKNFVRLKKNRLHKHFHIIMINDIVTAYIMFVSQNDSIGNYRFTQAWHRPGKVPADVAEKHFQRSNRREATTFFFFRIQFRL